jgi:hypothetical protein
LVILRESTLSTVEVRSGIVMPSGRRWFTPAHIKADYVAVVTNGSVEYVPYSERAKANPICF